MEHRVSIVLVIVLCTAWQANATVNCTAAGRFPEPNDTTCKNYTLCVYVTANTTFIPYDYVCPSTSVFNPNTRLCTASTNYVCNVTTTNTTTPSLCTADGFIPDPNSSNCSSYIQCVDLFGNGTFSETILPCPSGTSYNPNTTQCDTTYNCPTTFTCSVTGRYANSTDTTCRSYFYCVLNATGTYIQYNYTCPSISVFNPATSLCTTNYTCPSS